MRYLYLALIVSALAPVAACQQASKGDEKAQEQAAKETAMNEAQRAYAAANAKMHAGMGHIPADADEAFIVGMIPHHQGAVDMAQIALKYGKDPEVRALAQTIIAAQAKEIAQMEAWLKKRGIDRKTAAAPGDHTGH